MIENDRQFHITKTQAERFERAVEDAASAPNPAIHPVLRKSQLDALRSQLSDLRRDLEEYTGSPQNL
jgi:hypothetical protein